MPFINVVVYGIGDFFSPCHLSSMVVFAAFLGWLRGKHLSIKNLTYYFLVLYFIALNFFSMGGLMNILYPREFLTFGRLFYTILGAIFVVKGFFCFKDWIRINQKIVSVEKSISEAGQSKPIFKLFGFQLIFFWAVFLSGMSTIWPPNRYISFYANYLNVPGERVSVASMLFLYSFMLVATMGLAFLFYSWTEPGGWLSKMPSKVKIVSSAYLLGLGFCLIYIFH